MSLTSFTFDGVSYPVLPSQLTPGTYRVQDPATGWNVVDGAATAQDAMNAALADFQSFDAAMAQRVDVPRQMTEAARAEIPGLGVGIPRQRN